MFFGGHRSACRGERFDNPGPTREGGKEGRKRAREGCTVDLEIFVYENFQGKFFRVKIFSWVSCTHENYFTRNFFYTQACSKNLLCWRLPCIICDIQEAAISTRL